MNIPNYVSDDYCVQIRSSDCFKQDTTSHFDPPKNILSGARGKISNKARSTLRESL